MKILLTGACGFVGATLAEKLATSSSNIEVIGFDNLSRPGSELNRSRIASFGVRLVHGDLRCQSDVDSIPSVDWIIDCAANPSVLAGSDGKTTARQLMEHNLFGTLQMLEKCQREKAGFILLSTSRVYSIEPLSLLPVEPVDGAYRLKADAQLPIGVSNLGIQESFSTTSPISLYGASKLASEALALEYGSTFGFPVWINRCGVLAGAGQFGRADQGIISYWINAHLRRRALRYIGFDGEGHQVRDCLHPKDLVPLLLRQMESAKAQNKPRLINVAGGIKSSFSLRQLTEWCAARFGSHPVARDPRPRPFDLPWVVLDSRKANEVWDWSPNTLPDEIFEEIADHALRHPNWLELSLGN